MRFKLISDRTDVVVGMRLAGITGVVAHTPEEVKNALDEYIKMDDVAIILITENLVKLCEDLVYELKNTCKKPLIVEIPDGMASEGKKDSITRYIRNAIGLKI